MSSVNKVILIGNLGANPEVRFTQDGRKIVNFSLATSESWKDKSTGEKKSKTEWHRVVIFAPSLADIAEKYLKKGSKIFLEGSLQTKKWTDKSNQERYVTEIILQGFNCGFTMLEGVDQKDKAGAQTQPKQAQSCTEQEYENKKSGGGEDEEIPF